MKINAIFAIFRKELARFFKDKRTLVALILPGVLIYVLYSLMGGAMSNSMTPDTTYKPQIIAVNIPDSVEQMFSNDTAILIKADETKLDEAKDNVTHNKTDLLMVFPAEFDKTISEGSAIPNIEIYYNSSSTNSSNAYRLTVSLLDALEASISNVFNINNGTEKYDLATNEDLTSMIFSKLMPMLLIMLLFSGCMAVAPESIAGEKERGTIATLLITPTKRGHIAIGKILALSILALISGASSTLGIILSLPKLMGDTVQLDGSVYGITDYALLAVVILSTVLLFITLISIISAFAKSIKEATTYVTPLMIGSTLIGLTGMVGGAVDNPALYLIPVYNSVQSMISIFSFSSSYVNIIITVITNIVICAIGVFALTRMFNDEKIMFNK